ncbi:hypothetical protein D9611_004224 [Ephemerocybe angulata]|uniref:endo-1,4-beta-xylanase n=1 Tax=Ephemerocybe angulata TaxID=980116 RepID=A0A8H5BJK1_9AGAR|nr:hypothetical protein D9611_004224 [Tulosesus angulatus]
MHFRLKPLRGMSRLLLVDMPAKYTVSATVVLLLSFQYSLANPLPTAWEVVKEVLNENGSLRNTVFSKTFEGPGFIPVAFKAARKADPKAKLYIDDYNLDKSPEKVAGLVDLVSQLNTEYPDLIDGISSQAHLGDLTLYPDNAVESALTALSGATGVKEVAISELDIPGAKPEDYASVIEACLKVEKCIGVTVWGISDTYSWRAATTPLLWDAEYKKKPAYYAISKALVKPE